MFAFPLNLLLCRRGERLKLWCSRKHVCLLRVFVLVCPCAWLHIRVHQKRVKLWNLLAWDRSHVGSFFSFLFFYPLWCVGETLCTFWSFIFLHFVGRDFLWLQLYHCWLQLFEVFLRGCHMSCCWSWMCIGHLNWCIMRKSAQCQVDSGQESG